MPASYFPVTGGDSLGSPPSSAHLQCEDSLFRSSGGETGCGIPTAPEEGPDFAVSGADKLSLQPWAHCGIWEEDASWGSAQSYGAVCHYVLLPCS